MTPRTLALLEQATIDAVRAVRHPAANRVLGELGLVRVSHRNTLTNKLRRRLMRVVMPRLTTAARRRQR